MRLEPAANAPPMLRSYSLPGQPGGVAGAYMVVPNRRLPQLRDAAYLGTVSYQFDPIEPPAADNVLICCSQPAADIVIDL